MDSARCGPSRIFERVLHARNGEGRLLSRGRNRVGCNVCRRGGNDDLCRPARAPRQTRLSPQAQSTQGRQENFSRARALYLESFEVQVQIDLSEYFPIRAQSPDDGDLSGGFDRARVRGFRAVRSVPTPRGNRTPRGHGGILRHDFFRRHSVRRRALCARRL